MSPSTSSSFSSPTSTFFRLSLDSPGIYSPRSDPGFAELPPIGSPSDTPSSLIYLPPIHPNPAMWNQPRRPSIVERRARGHQRSASEGSPHERTKLPPLRGLVDRIGLERSPVFSAAPTSPVNPRPPIDPSAVAPRPLSAPSSSSAPSTRIRPPRMHQRPSSLSNILPRTDEEPATATGRSLGGGYSFGTSFRVGGEEEAPLGLGMLAVASEFVEESDGRQERFDRARKMSYDLAAAQAQQHG